MTDLHEYYEKEAETTRRYDSPSFWDSRYHQKRKTRILSILNSDLNMNYFLDVGCGTGEYLTASLYFSLNTVGVDISKTYLKKIKDQYHNLQLIQATAEALPFKAKSIETVLSSETLEHLPNPNLLLKEISRVAQSKIVISTPNYGLFRIISALFSKKSLARLDQSVGHLHVFHLNELKVVLLKNNCKIISAEVLQVTPPIIGELLHLSPKMAKLIDILEGILQKLLPTEGNISLVTCEPKN